MSNQKEKLYQTDGYVETHLIEVEGLKVQRFIAVEGLTEVNRLFNRKR